MSDYERVKRLIVQAHKDDKMPAPKSLGQIAFDAYGDNRAWKDHRGSPMPPWEVVRPEIREAWEVAANAVRSELQGTGGAVNPNKE